MSALLLLAFKLIKYVVIITGCILIATGVIHEVNPYTWIGLFLIADSYILFAFARKVFIGS